MKIDQQSVDWLLSNAGAVIRYRTATELLEERDERKVEALKRDLLSDSLVRYWLGNLQPDFDRNVMHSGKPEAYENAMGKLYEFGLRKGMAVLDERTKPFRRWLAKQIRIPNEGYFPVFYRTLTAAFLAMTGYADDAAVKTWILKRLETVHPFARKGDVSRVYVPRDSVKGVPKAFRNYPLIHPELYPNDEMRLPWIHDINAFLHSPFILEDSQLRAKAETIIGLIVKPEYQRLKEGYGVIRRESGRYYAMGWSVNLPGYCSAEVREQDFGRFLLLLNLMSRSKTAREHSWFKHSTTLLERFKTSGDVISFPRSFLPEKRYGYWISGNRMALETERRPQKAIMHESSFRCHEIMMKPRQLE